MKGTILAIRYPSDWRRVVMSRLLKPYKIKASTMAIIPRDFFDEITSKITDLGGSFDVIKDEIEITSRDVNDIEIFKRAVVEYDRLFESISNILRKKSISAKTFNELLRSIDLESIDRALKSIGNDDEK